MGPVEVTIKRKTTTITICTASQSHKLGLTLDLEKDPVTVSRVPEARNNIYNVVLQVYTPSPDPR